MWLSESNNKMKKTYHIEGMTCQGCRSGVEHILNSIPEVTKAIVNLENKEAVVTLKKYLDIDVLKKVMHDKYTITEKESNITDTPEVNSRKETEKSEVRQLFPLFLIFGYITITAILLNYNPFNLDGFMLDFMGLFYIVFSFFKMLDVRGFWQSFQMYDPLAKTLLVYGWVYPFVEVALGVFFLMRFRIEIALISTILVLGITTIGVTKVLVDKKKIPCACLGTALKLPMTKATFIENTMMLIMAIWMLIKIYF